MIQERTFDYIPRLDPRNLPYRVSVADPELLGRSRFWVAPRAVLDQGREGACVGHAVTHEYGSSPVRGKISNTLAFRIYERAQQLDPWEGENYDGTSVQAGMLAGREQGWWGGFRWALNMVELRAALELGPVVIGVLWTFEQYEAEGGVVRIGGPEAGWHALTITGYTPRHRKLAAPAYRWRNSWGKEYGINGSAYISETDLDSILFRAGGEASVPADRALA